MKKYIVVSIVISIIVIVGCFMFADYAEEHMYDGVALHRKLISVDTVDYEHTRYNSVYRKIYRRFDYRFQDSISKREWLNGDTVRDIVTNEYGDTLMIVYQDLSNFPRREED